MSYDYDLWLRTDSGPDAVLRDVADYMDAAWERSANSFHAHRHMVQVRRPSEDLARSFEEDLGFVPNIAIGFYPERLSETSPPDEDDDDRIEQRCAAAAHLLARSSSQGALIANGEVVVMVDRGDGLTLNIDGELWHLQNLERWLPPGATFARFDGFTQLEEVPAPAGEVRP